MKFDKKTHKVDIKTLNKDEALAYIWFLEYERKRHNGNIKDLRNGALFLNRNRQSFLCSAILRHQGDIKDIDKIISKVKAEFKI